MPAARRRRDPVLKDFIRTRDASMRALLQTVGKILDHDVNQEADRLMHELLRRSDH